MPRPGENDIEFDAQDRAEAYDEDNVTEGDERRTFEEFDDVLDVTATSDQLGKTAGRDAALGKQTYPALLGVERALGRASALITEACKAVAESGLESARLQQLAKFVILRES